MLFYFAPQIPCADTDASVPIGWYYLGPVATSEKKPERSGIIFKPLDPTAIADVVDWKKVGPNNEPEPPPPFSTWRGVAPDGYVVAGDSS